MDGLNAADEKMGGWWIKLLENPPPDEAAENGKDGKDVGDMRGEAEMQNCPNY